MSVKLSEMMKEQLDIEVTDQVSYTLELTDLESKQKFDKKKLESTSEGTYYLFVVVPIMVTCWMLFSLQWIGVLIGFSITAVATLIWRKVMKSKEDKLKQQHREEIKSLEKKYNLVSRQGE